SGTIISQWDLQKRFGQADSGWLLWLFGQRQARTQFLEKPKRGFPLLLSLFLRAVNKQCSPWKTLYRITSPRLSNVVIIDKLSPPFCPSF
ncbi:hypothetical protein BC937DRAFT_91368, partial [Endogone sp. FLAS-F59071]